MISQNGHDFVISLILFSDIINSIDFVISLIRFSDITNSFLFSDITKSILCYH